METPKLHDQGQALRVRAETLPGFSSPLEDRRETKHRDMNQLKYVPMLFSNEQQFDHFMDLVTHQELWGVFRKVNHLKDLTEQYLEIRRLQMKLFPLHDSELEMELLFIHIELLRKL